MLNCGPLAHPLDGAKGFPPLGSGSSLNWGSDFLLAASRELIGLFSNEI